MVERITDFIKFKVHPEDSRANSSLFSQPDTDPQDETFELPVDPEKPQQLREKVGRIYPDTPAGSNLPLARGLNRLKRVQDVTDRMETLQRRHRKWRQ
jgi:hypothetical protein